MQIKWTKRGLTDVARLHEFLAAMDSSAAASVVRKLTNAPNMFLKTPRMGEQLFEFSPREVRRVFVGQYEVRYEIREYTIFILRVWHTRESR